MLTDPHDATIACTIITLAHSLGLEVVAEGVETDGQRLFLLRNGCRKFQGYLFGRPGSVELL
ncbi:putative cyclic-di-GMP phosphodiesterase AdrB [compost metagenome]